MTKVTMFSGFMPKRIYVDREESARRQSPVWVVEVNGERMRGSKVEIRGEIVSKSAWGEKPSMWFETMDQVDLEQDSRDD